MTPALRICVFALAVAQGSAQDWSALIQDRLSYAEPLPSDRPFWKRSKSKGIEESHIMEQTPAAAPEPAKTEERKLASHMGEVVVKAKKESDWMYSKEVRGAQTSLGNLRSLNMLLKMITGANHTKDYMPQLRSAFKSKTFQDALVSVAYGIQKNATKVDHYARKEADKLWKEATSTTTESEALEAFKKFFAGQANFDKAIAEGKAHNVEVLAKSLPEPLPKERWEFIQDQVRAEVRGFGELYTDLVSTTDIDAWCKKLNLILGSVAEYSGTLEKALNEAVVATKEFPSVAKALTDSDLNAEKAALESAQAFQEFYVHQIAANKLLTARVAQSAKRMFQCELSA